jgi:hypothetical protein
LIYATDEVLYAGRQASGQAIRWAAGLEGIRRLSQASKINTGRHRLMWVSKIYAGIKYMQAGRQISAGF